MYCMLRTFVFCCVFCSVFCGESKCRITSSPEITVDCSGMNYSQIPSYLEALKDHANSKKLILSHNKLNSSTTFHTWSSLMSLDVSHNNLNNITNGTFGPLSHLKLLNISNNNVSEITPSAFDELTVLEILDLSENPLLGSNIEMLNASLAGLLYKSLKKFSLRSSGLSHIPIGMFEKAHELQYLDLSDNNITVIPILPRSLIYFNANNNNIKTLDILSFKKSELLKDLYVEENLLLRDIDVDAFELMYNLRNLSFRGCKSLESLPPNVLYFNKKLKYLSLADCGLTTVPHSFKSIFLSIPTLELQDNPWVCNVSIRWFIALEESKTESLRCSKPANYSLSEYYGPKYRHQILGKILMGLLGAVFILFGVAIYLSYSIGKRKKRETPYLPLGKNTLPNSVYVTTVV